MKKKRSIVSALAGAVMAATTVGAVGVVGQAGAATSLGNQKSTYFPPKKVAYSQQLTWKTGPANTKLLTIIGTYPTSTG
ncbi:MAG TPA: hypothetical protein VHB02_18065, partial [Acidimicrobiales bacterium]|nr:hypothetical protein [Acidimicrobiales bacterium]